MINKKSKTQKAIENLKVPKAVQTAIEDLFAKEFHLGFDFDTEIQASKLRPVPIAESLENGSVRPVAIKDRLDKGAYSCHDIFLGPPVTVKGINYAPASFIEVTSKHGRPFDLYIIEERHRNAFIRSWVVRDYPQDQDFYHRYELQKRLNAVNRWSYGKRKS